MNKKRFFELPRVPLYYSIPLLVVCIFAFLILLFLFGIEIPSILLQPFPSNVVNVSSCGTLSQSDTYYVLNQSIDSLGAFCIVVSGNNVIFDGKSMYMITKSSGSGDVVYVNGDNVTITGVNITSLGSGRIGYGIYSTGREINIFNNYIHNATAGGIGLENNSGGIINKNSIYDSYLGINLRGFSNSFVTQNLIAGYNSSLRTSFGIILEPTPEGVFTSNNSVSNNVIKETSYGIKLEGGSVDSNLLSDNIIISPFLSGLSSYVGYSNVLRNISIFNPRRNGIEVIVPSYLPNPMTIMSDKIRVINGNQSHYDLYVNNPSFHNSSIIIIDNSFATYLLNNTYLTFNNSFARIMFNQILNVSGNNLSSDVETRFNYVSVDSVLRRGLNKSAIISFFGLPTNITNATIYRDGLPCPTSVCFNLTSLNSGNVSFMVNGWSNYYIGEGTISPGSSPSISINEPDNNERYSYSAGFPVTFSVSLNLNGTVKFSLNNGSTNTTMRNTNNREFDYEQNQLPLGNYTFTAYANFSGGVNLSSFVKFSVINTTGSSGGSSGGGSSGGSSGGGGGGGSGGGSSSGNSGGNSTFGGSSGGSNLFNSTSGGSSGETQTFTPKQSSSLKNIVYWLIVGIILAMIIILVLLIVKALRDKFEKKSFENKPIMVSNLR